MLAVPRRAYVTPNTLPERDEFLSFVALTEDEVDEVCDRLRRKFGAGIFSAAGTSRKEQVRSRIRIWEQRST